MSISHVYMSTPMPLPSLNSLRTFEAAARLLSFNLAAEELNVTPSAVSHQIRQLELTLETQLFRRLDKQVVLTPEGQRYYPQVHSGIRQLIEATQRLQKSRNKGVLRLSVAPIFATRWLMPRMVRFQAEAPQLEVSIQATTTNTDFKTDEVDIAIRYGSGDWPGLNAILLLEETLCPVCSPDFLPKLQATEQQSSIPLITTSVRPGEWKQWAEYSHMEHLQLQNGPVFESISQTLEAVIAGAGLAIVDPILISRELENGHLVMPFDMRCPSEKGYYLVYPHSDKDREIVQLFEQWLLKEIEIKN